MAEPTLSRKVLWIDNDPGFIKPFVSALGDEGFSVTMASTAAQAESLLLRDVYGLVILDVMIPTSDSEEEERYPPDETDASLKTGVVFFRRQKALLDAAGTAVLVMTVRIDKQIRDELIAAGLPAANFSTKMELREMQSFLAKIQSIMARKK